MEPWMVITQLEKKIDDFKLGPIDLRIEPGTITALVGNNGSGKSTLMKLMMNLAKPDMGNIKLFGKFVYGYDETWKKLVAYQPQTMLGYDTFTGETLKNLIAPLYPYWDEALFKEIVQAFDIPLTKRFGKLSQGAQQKLGLALTIARNADLMILDEPTSYIDIPSKKALTDILVHWMEQGNHAIIITSHQAEDIRKLADYITVLNNGKMVGIFEKEQLAETYKRYWIHDTLPERRVPGEIKRESKQIISSQPEATELFLKNHYIDWSNRAALELDEIISLLLTNTKER